VQWNRWLNEREAGIQMTLELSGKQLGPYKVASLIGRGGMAAVYQAFHPATDRQVAIKVMLPDVATDEVFQRRFEREAKTLAGLQHIHILSVFDYGEQDGVNYLVMPYLPGRTLGDRLEETQMSLADVAATFRQLASALDYAHRQGILHRNVKPAHVLLFETDGVRRAKLTGLSGRKAWELSGEPPPDETASNATPTMEPVPDEVGREAS